MIGLVGREGLYNLNEAWRGMRGFVQMNFVRKSSDNFALDAETGVKITQVSMDRERAHYALSVGNDSLKFYATDWEYLRSEVDGVDTMNAVYRVHIQAGQTYRLGGDILSEQQVRKVIEYSLLGWSMCLWPDLVVTTNVSFE